MVITIIILLLAVGMFVIGLCVARARQNSQTLKNITDFKKACDKIDEKVDLRTDNEVLKKK